MKYKGIFGAAILATGIAFSGVAAAGAPAENAIKACRVAIEESSSNDVIARLSKIKTRGNNYEVWMNVSSDSGEQMRTYCYTRRGEVDQFVLEDGKWVGRNPRRPESVDLG
ncbi:MAG: hypothetical protein QNJ73_04140 [Gammaproteobacteria bacterium]|nr:hypothetical protein [Gammaproteobacteria bacterium]